MTTDSENLDQEQSDDNPPDYRLHVYSIQNSERNEINLNRNVHSSPLKGFHHSSGQESGDENQVCYTPTVMLTSICALSQCQHHRSKYYRCQY